MPSWSVRAFAPDTDMASVQHLLALSTPAYFAPAEAADFEHYLHTAREDYFVLLHEGSLIACGGINYPTAHTAVLSWDMVHPAHHQKGWGRALTHYRLAYIRHKPAITTVRVRTTDVVFPFYKKMGFSLVAIVPHFWAGVFDMYVGQLTR